MSAINRLFRLLSAGVVALALMTSCGTSRKVTTVASGKGNATRPIEYVKIPSTLNKPEKALLTEAKKWLGTPYKYGGETRDGVDCSGLVLNVFRDALNIKLPRSSRQQFDFTQFINRNELIPGDLVFFATGRDSKNVSHVGLYIGEDKIVHSSASQGVMVSRLSEDYFTRTFVGAGRVESYYAMVNKTEPVGIEEIAEPVIQKPLQATVTPSPSPAPIIKYEPVAEIPARKEPSASLSAEEARRMVLNSLIEQKLDSIYATIE